MQPFSDWRFSTCTSGFFSQRENIEILEFIKLQIELLPVAQWTGARRQATVQKWRNDERRGERNRGNDRLENKKRN